jgi:hypothetical protein
METERHLLETLADSLEIPRRLLKQDLDTWIIQGRYGTIQTDAASWFVLLHCKSKRAWSATKRKLAFMSLIDDLSDGGRLSLDRMPTTGEGPIIRRAVGLKKKPRTMRGSW